MRESFYEFMQEFLHANHARNSEVIPKEISGNIPWKISNATHRGVR